MVPLPVSSISSEVHNSAHVHSPSSILISLPPHWHSHSGDQSETKQQEFQAEVNHCLSASFHARPFMFYLNDSDPPPTETKLNHWAVQIMQTVSRLWEALTSSFGKKTGKSHPERRSHLLLFVSAQGKINEDHLFGAAMTPKTRRRRTMWAMCAVSGPFTWHFVDRVGLAMMDFCFSYTEPLELCVRVCVYKPEGCAPQGSVYEKKWFRVNSSDKWHGLSLDGGACSAQAVYGKPQKPVSKPQATPYFTTTTAR